MKRESKHDRWLRHRREGQQPPKSQEFFGEEVGIIMGVQRHAVPRLPSVQAWARAVPKHLRKPGPVEKK